MLPDRVWNPGPLTYESGALPIALRGLAGVKLKSFMTKIFSVMGKVLSGELSCPCDRSCYFWHFTVGPSTIN